MKAALAFSLFLICSVSRADVYVLGSSYSSDAVPASLDDRPQWHIDCGKSLQYILDNPLAPCDITSTIWPVALSATQFKYVSFQPVRDVAGVTEQSDIDAIGYWLSLQPTAVGVIHHTWPRPSEWEADFHNAHPDNALTNYSQRYTFDLIHALQAANPGRRIVSDRANEILDRIYHDIQNGVGPLTDFRQLFRDEGGHLGNYGNYLAHNALRQAFGQRTGIDSSPDGVPLDVQKYLDARIRACRPASALVDWRQNVCDPWACSAIGTVGPQGGSISSLPTCPGRGVTIQIPEGALGDTVEVSVLNTVSAYSLAVPRSLGPVMSSVRIEPADLRLSPAATITFHWVEFSSSRGDVGGSRRQEDDLAIYRNGERVAVCGSSRDTQMPHCDTEENTFTIELDSGGEFLLSLPRPGVAP
jgi:hypothetical protein